jgi:hypothetical protein
MPVAPCFFVLNSVRNFVRAIPRPYLAHTFEAAVHPAFLGGSPRAAFKSATICRKRLASGVNNSRFCEVVAALQLGHDLRFQAEGIDLNFDVAHGSPFQRR